MPVPARRTMRKPSMRCSGHLGEVGQRPFAHDLAFAVGLAQQDGSGELRLGTWSIYIGMPDAIAFVLAIRPGCCRKKLLQTQLPTIGAGLNFKNEPTRKFHSAAGNVSVPLKRRCAR